jgi:effector-binding domain-containing protein/uncharacterized protein YndB with AHSA1/START domain
MKTVKILIYVVLGMLALVTVIAFFLPSAARVERTAVIHAPREAVFAAVNTFTLWPDWSPWLRLDPSAKLVFGGPASGKGSWYTWESEDSRLATGKIEILESHPFRDIVYSLRFDDMEAMTADFKLVDLGNGTTKVTWGIDGRFGLNPVSRWFGVFFDDMIGPDFEQGLANIDSIMIATAKRLSPIREESFVGGPVLQVTTTTSTDAIGAALARSYADIMQYAAGKGLQPTGAPYAMYPDWKGATTGLVAGMPFAVADPGNGTVVGATLPPGRVLTIDYYGPYEFACLAYKAMDEHIKRQGIAYSGTSWETYVTDPGQERDKRKWLTRVQYRLQ